MEKLATSVSSALGLNSESYLCQGVLAMRECLGSGGIQVVSAYTQAVCLDYCLQGFVSPP